MQALLEIEKALTRKERAVGLIIGGIGTVTLIASAVVSTVALTQGIQKAHVLTT
jgi:hypothetical protein